MSPPTWTGARAGVLNRVYGTAGDSSVFDTAIAVIERAEALGLGTAWVAQHHFGGETGQLPSPLLLLANASQVPRRIGLGTAVIVLPLEPVVRLAEDAAVLDALSGGRLELGLGGGFDDPSFGAFGQDIAARGDVYSERIDTLGRILSGAELTPDGDVRLIPPAMGLRQRLWEATGAAETVAACGNGLITAPQPPGRANTASLVGRYLDAWQRHGHAGRPRVALVRGIFPGSDAASVEAEIGPDIARYLQDRGGSGSAAELPGLLRRLGVAWGSPAQIVDQLAEDDGLAGIDQIVAQVQTFSTTRHAALRRLQLFAERVVPALPTVRAFA